MRGDFWWLGNFLKRSAPNRGATKAAEGETVVAITVVWRVDGAGIKFEVVRVGSWRVGPRRPIVAVHASVQESNTITARQEDVPAAHEEVVIPCYQERKKRDNPLFSEKSCNFVMLEI